jgi:integrase
LTRKYCVENPALETREAKAIDGPVEILSVGQIARLLSESAAETLPYWAIGAFAGLRRAEVERLLWSDVDFDSGLIEVHAKNSKTATRRLVTIHPNLRAWLAPYEAMSGSVCPVNLQRKLNEDRERAGLLGSWPQNALRHSFGSYHLARFNDAAALALQMGNSPEVIFKHYRQLVKPRAAEAYWNIMPVSASEERVVRFAPGRP